MHIPLKIFLTFYLVLCKRFGYVMQSVWKRWVLGKTNSITFPTTSQPTSQQLILFLLFRFIFVIAHDKFALIPSMSLHWSNDKTRTFQHIFNYRAQIASDHSSNYVMPRHEQYALNSWCHERFGSNVVIYRNTEISAFFFCFTEFNQNGSNFMIPKEGNNH